MLLLLPISLLSVPEVQPARSRVLRDRQDVRGCGLWCRDARVGRLRREGGRLQPARAEDGQQVEASTTDTRGDRPAIPGHQRGEPRRAAGQHRSGNGQRTDVGGGRKLAVRRRQPSCHPYSDTEPLVDASRVSHPSFSPPSCPSPLCAALALSWCARGIASAFIGQHAARRTFSARQRPLRRAWG